MLAREPSAGATRSTERRVASSSVCRCRAGGASALSATRSAGYDWIGLFMGRLAPQRWTCIGACLELYRRLGVPHQRLRHRPARLRHLAARPDHAGALPVGSRFRVLTSDDRESEAPGASGRPAGRRGLSVNRGAA